MDVSSSNTFKMRKYLKWTVGLERSGFPIVSNKFWCQCVERYFKLSVHPIKPDWLFLYLESKDEDFEPFEVTVFIEEFAEPCRVSVVNAIQQVSSYNRQRFGDLMKQFNCSSLTFVVLFPADADLKLHQGQNDARRNLSDHCASDLETLSTDIGKLLEDQSSHDAVLECEGELFYVHTDILSARSEKFAQLLLDENADSNSH